MSDEFAVAPQQGAVQQNYQPYPPAPWAPPVTGFVLALLVPIVGIFICHSEKKQAAAIGQDNALARAGFILALVACIIGVTVAILYAVMAAVFLTSLESLTTTS